MMRTLDTYTPTRFMAAGSTYDKRKADFAVAFIQALKHTKGRWSGQPFQLIDWQEQIIRQSRRLPPVHYRLCRDPQEAGQIRACRRRRPAADVWGW